MTQDLMGMLQAAYEARNATIPPGEFDRALNAAVQDFVDCAREYLRANQPVSMEFLAAGLSLRFQDGSVVPFLPLAEEPGQVSGIQGGMEITKPDTRREKPQPGTFSFGITNGQ